jgi:hypothetical protein
MGNDQSWDYEATAEEWYDDDEAEEGYQYEGDYREDSDPDEFDNIHSNCIEARKKFAELRTFRGFFPVVAVTPEGATGGKSRGKGKGKGQDKSRSKDKSSSGGQGKSGKRSGKGGKGKRKGPRPSQAPPRTSSSTCLRCGKPGHWASERPEPPRKRPSPRNPPAVDRICLIAIDEPEHIDDLCVTRKGQ